MSEEALPAWNLMQTAHVVGLKFGELMASEGLSPTQFAVLMHLDGDSDLTQAELARRVLIRPQSMRVLVESLLERGLIERSGIGGRGRRVGIALTAAGQSAMLKAWQPVREFNAPATLGLTPAQAAMLDELLTHVRAAIGTHGDTS